MLIKSLRLLAILGSPIGLGLAIPAAPMLSNVLTGLIFVGLAIPPALAGVLLILSALYGLAIVDFTPVLAVLIFV